MSMFQLGWFVWEVNRARLMWMILSMTRRENTDKVLQKTFLVFAGRFGVRTWKILVKAHGEFTVTLTKLMRTRVSPGSFCFPRYFDVVKCNYNYMKYFTM